MGSKGVEELDLTICSNSTSDYNLPSWLFKCETLVSMKLRGCRIDVPLFVRFSSLTNLSLLGIYLTDEMLTDLLTACPLLEDLVIEGGSRMTTLRVSCSSNSRLKHLIVYGFWIGRVEVDAPNLQILKFYGRMGVHCSCKYMPSLVQAKLYLQSYTVSAAMPELSMLKSSVHDLRHAKVLELFSYCILAMHNPTFEDPHSYIFETKCLILETGLTKFELPGIANLLWSSPNLETLVNELVPPDQVVVYGGNDKDHITSKNDSNEGEYWESLTVSFPCLIHRLKSIKITDFIQQDTDPCGDNDEEISLVRFLLRNAMILEKITIHASQKPYSVRKKNG